MGKFSAKNVVLFTLFATNLVDQPAPLIEIDQGKLIGKISSDGNFYEYLGIPYGTATSRNRFQAPLPPPSWSGTYRAVDEHHTCMQRSLAVGAVSGTEDCLKINVYVPVTNKPNLPVMVWIHGGAFILGSGGKLVYSPEFLVKHEVILVTFNYRLGPLGFLCLGIKEAPGNAGLKDQVAALRWVKKNIEHFGGDPENITLFGQSAGGTSVSAMILTNATNGLFQRAIVQSGSIIATWGINPQPLMTAALLARAIGYQGPEDPLKMYEFLSKAPLEDLMTAQPKKPFHKFFDTELISLPCVENSFPGIEPLFTDRPFNVLKSYGKNISIIFGSTDKEGWFLINESQRKVIFDRNDGYLFSSDLEFPSEKEAERVAKKVKDLYFGDQRISIERLDNVTNLYTHLYFDIPGLLETDVYVQNPNISVYNYQFRYNGNRNILKYITGYGNLTGACHGDELFYLFNSRYWPIRVKNDDIIMVDWITSLWTNFAKFGDPTPKFKSDFPVTWEPSRVGDKKVLYLDKEPRMGRVPNMEAYDLWRDVYSKYRRKSWTR